TRSAESSPLPYCLSRQECQSPGTAPPPVVTMRAGLHRARSDAAMPRPAVRHSRAGLRLRRVLTVMKPLPSVVPTEYWHRLDDGRVQCDLCPRYCKLHEGQRGFCFVRACQGGEVVLTTYGRSSGFCVDPIEKKPLYHFLPGTPVLSFGTAGCNLGCRFCHNW